MLYLTDYIKEECTHHKIHKNLDLPYPCYTFTTHDLHVAACKLKNNKYVFVRVFPLLFHDLTSNIKDGNVYNCIRRAYIRQNIGSFYRKLFFNSK